MVTNALWLWEDQWKKTNWHHRGKTLWAAKLGQDITSQVEKVGIKVCHVDAHGPKGWSTEEHCHNRQVDQAPKIKLFPCRYIILTFSTFSSPLQCNAMGWGGTGVGREEAAHGWEHFSGNTKLENASPKP